VVGALVAVVVAVLLALLERAVLAVTGQRQLETFPVVAAVATVAVPLAVMQLIQHQAVLAAITHLVLEAGLVAQQ
jgi:hypothetical protein